MGQRVKVLDVFGGFLLDFFSTVRWRCIRAVFSGGGKPEGLNFELPERRDENWRLAEGRGWFGAWPLYDSN
jgi:hypothetical protein